MEDSRSKDNRTTSCMDEMTCATPLSHVMQCVNHDDKNLTNKQENWRTHVSVFMCAVLKVFCFLVVHVVIGVVLGFTRRRNTLDGHVVIGVVLGFTTQTQYPVQISFLLDFVVHLCTCSQTVFCDRQFLSVANYCTLLHRENGSFEVLSLHTPSVTVDRRQL